MSTQFLSRYRVFKKLFGDVCSVCCSKSKREGRSCRDFSTSKTLKSSGTALEGSVLEFMNKTADFGGTGGAGTIFSDTGPVLKTVELLCTVKDLEGMTWIQIILLGTIAIRITIGLPIAITQQRAIGRLQGLQPKVQELAEELRKETGYAIRKFNWDEKTAKRQFRKSYKNHWRRLVEENNCHPMRSLCLGILQIPAWICFSSALRNVVYAVPLPRTEDKAIRWFEMYQEGTPWLSNLTVCDPVVFPLIFMTANLVNIRLHAVKKVPVVQTTLQKALPWIFTSCILGITVLAGYVPAAVSMYWAVSSSSALVQNVILLNPGVRKALKIPLDAPTK